METGYRSPTPNLYNQNQYSFADELMRTGLIGDAPDLYNQDQYRFGRELMDTGLEGDLMKSGTTMMRNRIAPALAEQYAGQMGTFSTDFLGSLNRESENLAADLAKTVSANRQAGLGALNSMTSSQGLLDADFTKTRAANRQAGLGALNEMTSQQGLLGSQLDEAAAARRANALTLYPELATMGLNLPTAFANDLAAFGAQQRATDESIRPGGRNLSTLLSLLTGSSPSILGPVAQGQTPSASTQLLSGFAPQTANFGQAALGSLLNGAGNWLGQNALGLGGSLLSGLGGLIGNLGSSVWSGITGLFGGGNDNDYGSYNNYDYSWMA
jgi:hypothetical protein